MADLSSSRIIEAMPQEASPVERASPLQLLYSPQLSPALQVWQAAYRRRIPGHYQDNPLTRAEVRINLILVPGGSLVIPSSPQTNFSAFFARLKQVKPVLFHRILSPSATAKAASTDLFTPIKELTSLRLPEASLPGDPELYGWPALQAESQAKGLSLQLLFQGNGLYFNRGSGFFDGQNLLVYPDLFQAEVLQNIPSSAIHELLGVAETGLKRPLLWLVLHQNGRTAPYLHHFDQSKSYQQGLQQLAESFHLQQVRAALATSPPLVIPNEDGNPKHLPLPEIIATFQANDVRHYLYCPYAGAVLLAAELGRAQCLQPENLARSLSGRREDRIKVRLLETLRFVTLPELSHILEAKGYAGRYHITAEADGTFLHLNPLEGVYSHLVPFVTQNGRLGLLQTSGTRCNITGNDGPTIGQLSAILQDLNTQPPFAGDAIIAAASGSQGNDVPNIVCSSNEDVSGLLHILAPQTALDEICAPRGTVTTPRVGIAC
jgi:hypothetical protein